MRRKFYEPHVNDSSRLATTTIEEIAWLRASYIRQSVRVRIPKLGQATPRAIGHYGRRTLQFVGAVAPPPMGKSKLGEAISSALSRPAVLNCFLDEAASRSTQHRRTRHLSSDHHSRERSVRRFRRRRSHLGHHRATLLTTINMNDADPTAWLTEMLKRLAGDLPNRKKSTASCRGTTPPDRSQLTAYNIRAPFAGCWTTSQAGLSPPIRSCFATLGA